jgi:hypothetical protein
MGDNTEDLLLKISGDSTGGQQAIQGVTDAAGTLKTGLTDLGSQAKVFGEAIANGIEHPLQAVGEALKSALNQLGPFGAGLLAVGTAVSAVATAFIELGQHATELGAQLEVVSMTTGIAVGALSDLKFAMDSTGGSLEQLNTVMFMFEQRLENSSGKVDAGLHLLGLSIEEIQGLSRDEQFLAIAKAFQTSGEEVNKAAAAMDIFGRQGRGLLPQLMQPLGELTAKSQELNNTWSVGAAKAAHDFEISQTTMAAEATSAWTQIGRSIAPVTNDLVWAYDRMKVAIANVALTTAGTFEKVANGLVYLTGATGNYELAVQEAGAKQDTINRALALGAAVGISYGDAVKYINTQYANAAGVTEWTTKQQKAIDSILAGLKGEGDRTKETTEAIKQAIAAGDLDVDGKTRVVAAIEKLKKAHVALDPDLQTFLKTNIALSSEYPKIQKGIEEVAKALEKWQEAFWAVTAAGGVAQDLIDSLDGNVLEGTKYYLERGKTVEAVALMYGVAKDAVQAVKDQEDFLVSTLRDTTREFGNQYPTVGLIAARFGDLHSTLTGVNDDLDGTLKSTTIAGEGLQQMTGHLVAVDTTEEGLKKHLNEFRSTTLPSFSGTLRTELASIPDIFIKAFEGGGGVSGALKAIGVKLGQEFGAQLKQGIADSIAAGGSGTSGATNLASAELGALGGAGIASEGSSSSTGSKIAQVGMLGVTAGVGAAMAVSAAAVAAGEVATTSSLLAAGAVTGAWTAGIGLAAVGVYLLYEHLKGATQAEKDARTAYANWETQVVSTFDKIATNDEKATAGTDKIAKTTLLVGDAYRALGLDGSKAAHDVGVALDATHHSAADVATATDAMSKALAAYTKLLPLAQQGEKDLTAGLLTLTSITPDVAVGLQAVYDAKNIGEYTDAVTKVNLLIKTQATDTANVDATLKKYGLTWQELGSTARAAHLDTIAQGLITDFTTLAKAGVDVNVEIKAMAPALNDFVKQAQKAGVEVPEGMKPALQAAIDAGLLFDSNGKKVTDLTQLNLTFGKTMTQGFQSVTDAITKLADVLTKGLAGGFQAATDKANGLGDAINHLPTDHAVHVRFDDSGGPTLAATGGFVTAHGVAQYLAAGGFPGGPRGSDTVPAWLTPGERVLSVAQNQALTMAMATMSRNRQLGAMLSPLGMPRETSSTASLPMPGGTGAMNITVNAPGSLFQDRASMRELAVVVSDHLTEYFTQLGGTVR